MVNQAIFSQRLDALDDYLRKLTAFQGVDRDEFVREPAMFDLAERYLHLVVECVLDLANHYIADRGLPAPATNRDSFTTLEQAGELPAVVAENMRQWAGLRNILVHQYLNIDHAMTHRIIQDDLHQVQA
jgi:uncharacterized protein YutE (UPF0331/DUF86 family)